MTEVIRPYEENERGAHSEKNADMRIPGKRRRGRHYKQGDMEEEAKQLYRRPQKTGRASDGEEIHELAYLLWDYTDLVRSQ